MPASRQFHLACRSWRSVIFPLVALGTAALSSMVIAPANASEATTYASVTDSEVRYQAAPGEANDVTVTQDDPSSVVIVDTGADITPGPGCTASATGAVTCSGLHISRLDVYLGDGDDRASVDVDVYAVVDGGDGNDLLSTVSATGYLAGGMGDDTLTSGGGNDYVDGGPGDNVIDTGAGNDTVYTGDGADTVDVGTGNDTVQPRGLGADNLHGGPGVDLISYQLYWWQTYDPNRGVDVSLDDVANDGASGSGIGNVHSDFEDITTGGGNDTIIGSEAANVIISDFGNDVVHGVGGRDRLYGGAGDDLLSGGTGDDRIDGSSGSDVVDGGDGDDGFSGSDGAGTNSLSGDTYQGGDGEDFIDMVRQGDVSVSLDDVANDGEAGEVDNVRSDIEDVVTGEGDDTILGSGSANDFSGGAGNDTIRGRGGNDGVDGGLGRDTLRGGQGTDSISGGGGVDTIRTQDRSPDVVACGSSIDFLDRDKRDQVAVDCENLS